MRKNRFSRFLKFVLFALLVLTLFSFFVMRLWNWLTPNLFGWHMITFWQALGILVLSKILFGGFRGGPPRGPWGWRGRMIDRWEHMTPEEREKFRQGIGEFCGPFGSKTPEAKA